jgi:chaperonin cofactor prefoldin
MRRASYINTNIMTLKNQTKRGTKKLKALKKQWKSS